MRTNEKYLLLTVVSPNIIKVSLRAVYIHYKGQIDEIIGFYDFYTWPTPIAFIEHEARTYTIMSPINSSIKWFAKD
jgi:hypothetical protein